MDVLRVLTLNVGDIVCFTNSILMKLKGDN